MVEKVAHRGPDDSASQFLDGRVAQPVHPSGESADWTVGLGHRRLSILDLSPAGRQPMVYRDRYWIVTNGELYNYLELRSELTQLGHEFRSESDTEVVLASYAEWGADCFARFRGMWGMLIVDLEAGIAVLCRDRMGIKPLYLWRDRSKIAIGSEIKQFLELPGFPAKINESVAREFLFSGYENALESFFESVKPVPAGTYLTIDLSDLKVSEPVSYWDPSKITPTIFRIEEAAEALKSQLTESVSLHLRSDVPVGAALSGGMDSSSLTALINELRESKVPTHTFTITFPNDPIDERYYAEEVLREVNAIPTFIQLSPKRFEEEWERFVWYSDEPVYNLSTYAGFCVARATREAGVPVTVNGQGGDEILAGYWQSYFVYLRRLMTSKRFLTLSQHLGGALLPTGNAGLWGQMPGMYRRYKSKTKKVQASGRGERNTVDNFLTLDEQGQRLEQLRSLFLPRFLKWEDRNSMAFSVEGRYPFLDHKVIELALSFSSDILYSKGWTKYPLRRAMDGLLPRSVLWRKSKLGFVAPQRKWLRGPLRRRMEVMLAGDSVLWDYTCRDSLQEEFQQMLRGEASDSSMERIFRSFTFDSWARVFGAG